MQLPIQITFHNLPHSDAIESYARQRAEKLATFCDRMTSCRVVVESPHQHRNVRHYRVRIDIAVPGVEIVVSRAPDESPTHEDVYAAIDDAFDDAGRRLEDYVRQKRGDVKSHEGEYKHGRVKKLWSYEGYGFVETADGEEVYFHRNSVLGGAFDRLQIGSKVRFLEEAGEKGPQASTVVIS